MTSWHTPLITPAEFFYCVIALLAIEGLIWIVRRFFAGGKAEPELYEHVDGEGR